MQHDNRTIGEIMDNPEANIEEPTDEDESALDAATVDAQIGLDASMAATVQAALEYAPTIQSAREEAHIPPHVSVKDLVGQEIVIAYKSAQKAALPDTGELRNGFLCNIGVVATGQEMTVWIGQTALIRDLSRVRLPFRTTITKKGRTYQFS